MKNQIERVTRRVLAYQPASSPTPVARSNIPGRLGGALCPFHVAQAQPVIRETP